MTTVRAAQPRDIGDWVRMRTALWPDGAEDHQRSADRFFAGHRHEPAEVLLAFDESGHAMGFAELSIRNIVDSCDTDRVAYLEGWYVEPPVRRRGVGAALIAGAELWARQQGCTEFGSDSRIEDESSHLAHVALGFAETGRVVNFRKDLASK
jgi:aminoglycoside 6'-N-acetyltransferase I